MLFPVQMLLGAAGSILIAVWLFRLAFSKGVGRHPAPRIGRAAFVGMALMLPAGAAGMVAATAGLSSELGLRLYYSVSGTTAAFGCTATGLYTFVLAPGAYERRHPDHPSEFWSKATALTGMTSGSLLVGLGVAAAAVTAYLVVATPGL